LIVPLLLFTHASITPVAAAPARPTAVDPMSAATSVMTMPGLLLRKERANECNESMTPPSQYAGANASFCPPGDENNGGRNA
jgi:hypothetical protein